MTGQLTLRHTLTRISPPTIVALIVIVLDQVTKGLVVRAWPVPQSGYLSLIDSWLALTYIQNTGIAFGLFQGVSQLFTITSVVIVIGMTYYYLRHVPAGNPLLVVVFGLIVGGALGNVIDRIRLDFVVDWIETFAGRFPVFNLADSAVVIGIALFALHSLMNDNSRKPS
jgi:signal peptidase II